MPATIAVATLTPLTNRPAHSATGLALPRAEDDAADDAEREGGDDQRAAADPVRRAAR